MSLDRRFGWPYISIGTAFENALQRANLPDVTPQILSRRLLVGWVMRGASDVMLLGSGRSEDHQVT